MIKYLWIALLILGVGLILGSAIFFRRKEESELSSNLTQMPSFWVGSVSVVAGIICKFTL